MIIYTQLPALYYIYVDVDYPDKVEDEKKKEEERDWSY